MKILSNGAPHSLLWYIGHHTKAVYKCTISRYVKSRKYGPYGGTYTNIAKTASASLYFHCYNPISYSGHPRGSKKYRLAKMWGGGGVHEGHIWPTAYKEFSKMLINQTFLVKTLPKIYNLLRVEGKFLQLFLAQTSSRSVIFFSLKKVFLIKKSP